MLFRHFIPVLDLTDAGSDPITGAAVRLTPLTTDPVQDGDQGVLIWVEGEISGGTNPTVQIILEASPNGQTWAPFWQSGFQTVSPFVLTAYPRVQPPGVLDPPALLGVVRARVVPGGGAPGNLDRLRVLLGSTAPLRAGRMA